MPRGRSILKRLALVVLSLLAVSAVGILVVLLPFFDTFGDMESRMGSLKIPTDFELIAKEQNGLRSRFAAAPGPYSVWSYSAAWDEGRLCERLLALATEFGAVERVRAGDCAFSTTLSSGWKARLVNVWHYSLVLRATAPEHVRPHTSDEPCEASRARWEEARSSQKYSDDTLLRLRYEPCWVRDTDALVHVTLHGKVGH